MERHQTLRLHVPEPTRRPGEPADFSHLKIPPAGASDRPSVDADAHALRHLAFDLIRVLGDDGRAAGMWDPKLDADTLRRGLRMMALTRIYDERMYKAQR